MRTGRIIGGHKEKTAIYKTRQEALEEIDPADTLILDL